MVCGFVVMVDCDYLLYIVVVCFGDICWCSLLSPFCFVWVGSNVFCCCGSFVPRSQPLQLFDEFALFATEKWNELSARASVREIQRVYVRLLRVSGIWLHYEWTWKMARDLFSHLRRVALIRTRSKFIRLPP